MNFKMCTLNPLKERRHEEKDNTSPTTAMIMTVTKILSIPLCPGENPECKA